MDNYASLFHKTCRICCLPSNHKMVPLLDPTSESGLSIYGLGVKTFTNICLTTKVEIPSHMCQQCLYLLKHAVAFKLKCEHNNKRLQKFIENINNSSGEDFKEAFVKHILLNQNVFSKENENKCGTPTTVKIEITIGNNSESIKNEKTIDVENWDDNDDDSSDNDFTDEDEIMTNITDYINDIDICNTDNEDKIYDKYLDIMEDMTENSWKYTKKTPTSYKAKVPFIPRPKMIKKKKKLKNKIRIENPGNLRKFECNVCKKVLKTKPALLCHQQGHFGFRYVCELCGKNYRNSYHLQMHQASVHGIGKLLHCEHCDFKTGREAELTEHIRLHTGERPFTCEKCGLTFRTQYLYRKHGRHHSEKSVQCPQCPKKFHNKSYLEEHCNTYHDRKYIFPCKGCGIQYLSGCSLRKHLRKNSECSKQYGKGVTKRIHIDTIDNLILKPLRRPRQRVKEIV